MKKKNNAEHTLKHACLESDFQNCGSTYKQAVHVSLLYSCVIRTLAPDI